MAFLLRHFEPTAYHYKSIIVLKRVFYEAHIFTKEEYAMPAASDVADENYQLILARHVTQKSENNKSLYTDG